MALQGQSAQEMQRAQVLKMLDLSTSSGGSGWGGNQTFKVLIYDKFCKEVIAPLLKVGGLRSHGVSLHIALETDRNPLPDVPAVYFVEPTEENVLKIIEDLQKKLYESVYVNFASSVPRRLLQELAKGALQAGASAKVAGVYDRFVSFVSLAPTLFTLNMPEAYATLHSPRVSDQMMTMYISRIVDGLLSVLITMKALPIIRCPANDPVAEMVSRQLDERIRELLRSGGSAAAELFSDGGANARTDATGSASSQRPLLCILDRDLDLVTMLNHTCTYQAMAHDILGMKLNRLTIDVDKEGSTTNEKVKKSYDVDEKDKFWNDHAGEPFFDVAAGLDGEVQEFDKKRREMTTSDSADAMGDLTSGLASAFSAIPEMTERKRSLDMHTNIMTSILDAVKARDLGNYYNMEDQLSSQSVGTSVSQCEQLLVESQKGTVRDKTRALMVLYLTKTSISAEQLQSLKEGLEKLGGSTFGIQYLQHLTSIRNMALPSLASSGPSASAGASGASSMFGSLMSTGEGLFSKGLGAVKNMIPSTKEAVICQILEGLMEQKPGGVTENYLYLDPKAPPSTPGMEAPRLRSPFRRAVAFVVGGGNYTEMQSVHEWAQKHGRQVTYGSTDLVSPEGFVQELEVLGEQMAAK